jgi:hypothetical protein
LLAQPRWYQTLKDGTTKHAPNASSLLRETVYLYFVQMDKYIIVDESKKKK